MRAFNISLNGKKVCLAGIRGYGVLAVTITSVIGNHGTMSSLQVGGLDGKTREHFDWTQKRLREGDEIGIRIVEIRSPDKPVRKKLIDSAADLAAKKSYVRRMAKELGWKIQATSQRPS
jgi:hypothetical protein